LCQSHLHTASESFVRHKKIRIRFDFLHFRIRIFIGKDDKIRKKKMHTKISDSVCKELMSCTYVDMSVYSIQLVKNYYCHTHTIILRVSDLNKYKY